MSAPYGPRPLPKWLLATIAIGIGCTCLAFWAKGHWQRVEVINGLDVDVELEIGDSKTTVKQRTRATMRVPREPTVITAMAGTVEVERLLVNVPSSELVVYNIAGAAFVYRQTVTYDKHAGTSKENVVFCGQSLLELGSIDVWFDETPRPLSNPTTTAFSAATAKCRWCATARPGP